MAPGTGFERCFFGKLFVGMALTSFSVMFAPHAMGQSTSQPLLIQPEKSDCTPSAGVCYLDLTFKGGSIYQHADWYTTFIGKNKQGNLTITVTSQLEMGNVADTKASDPVTLTKNGNDVSLSYQGPITSQLPLTFSQISFDVKINQTLRDGLNDLFTLFAQQSAVSLPFSAATLGYVSLGKSIGDFLFKPELTKNRAVGHFAFTPTTAPAPGYYAVLSGEDTPDWSRFAAGLKLAPGGMLTSNAGDVRGVTYYIYEISYNSRRYPNLNAALSFGKSKPWASLYLSALTASSSGWTLDQHESVEGNLRKQLDDAQTLLIADPDVTAEEKLTIIREASDTTNKAYQSRYTSLVAAQGSVVSAGTITVGTTPVPTNPTVLSISHDQIDKALGQMANLRAATRAH
jgi:hypothetical protein